MPFCPGHEISDVLFFPRLGRSIGEVYHEHGPLFFLQQGLLYRITPGMNSAPHSRKAFLMIGTLENFTCPGIHKSKRLLIFWF
jgi:hypothetical protein